MRSSPKIMLSIGAFSLLIYFLYEGNKSRTERKAETSKDSSTPAPSTRRHSTKTSTIVSQDPAQPSERQPKAKGLTRLDSDIPIKFDAPYLDLTDAEILKRISIGVNYIESDRDPGPIASHLRPNVTVTSIDQACKLLYKTTPIPTEWFPQWGYEVENYYIFSGGKEKPPKDAFKRGFAIQKSNGRSWRYSDNPLPQIGGRQEKGPRPDDYPPTE